MVERHRRTLHPYEANYLKSEIEVGSNVRKKQTLQHICKLYRNGIVLPQDSKIGIENAILGALTNALSDEKVRRWALAALAYVGRKDACYKAVLGAISAHPNEPQVLAAAIATLFKFDSKNTQQLIIDQGVCSPEIITLSALQTANPKELDLSALKINVNNADPITLKLGLLLVGMDRAPESIFEPKYSNAEMVKVLGTHHEPIVSQYSVWAAAENSHLGVKHIGINLNLLDSQPPNVRSYVYRLFAEDKSQSTQRHDIICQGSNDTDVETRVGLSIGLRNQYYDGLEEITVDWLYDEHDDDVRANILDHIVAQAHKFSPYKPIALEHYEFASNDPAKRNRMQAAAAGTSLHSDFQRIKLQEEAGLFNFTGGGMTTNNFNNYGSIGVMSQSGEANNNGNIQNVLTLSQTKEAHTILSEIEGSLVDVPLSDVAKDELQQAIEGAKTAPTKDTIGKVVTVLKKVESGLQAISGMGEYALKIGINVAALAALL